MARWAISFFFCFRTLGFQLLYSRTLRYELKIIIFSYSSWIFSRNVCRSQWYLYGKLNTAANSRTAQGLRIRQSLLCLWFPLVKNDKFCLTSSQNHTHFSKFHVTFFLEHCLSNMPILSLGFLWHKLPTFSKNMRMSKSRAPFSSLKFCFKVIS